MSTINLDIQIIDNTRMVFCVISTYFRCLYSYLSDHIILQQLFYSISNSNISCFLICTVIFCLDFSPSAFLPNLSLSLTPFFLPSFLPPFFPSFLPFFLPSTPSYFLPSFPFFLPLLPSIFSSLIISCPGDTPNSITENEFQTMGQVSEGYSGSDISVVVSK